MFLVRTRRLACALQRLSKLIIKFESLLLEVTFLLHDLSFFPLAVLICIITFFFFFALVWNRSTVKVQK